VVIETAAKAARSIGRFMGTSADEWVGASPM
jgi:hypothetical protein